MEPFRAVAARLRRCATGPLNTVYTLRNDPIVRIWAIVSATLLLLVLLPLPLKALDPYGSPSPEAPLILVALAAFQYGLGRIPDMPTRRFWNLWTAGFGLWLAAQVLHLATPFGSRGRDDAELSRSLLSFGFYLFIAFALEVKPHCPVDGRAAGRIPQLQAVGTIALAFGLVVYFSLIPGVLHPGAHAIPWAVLFVALDGYLALRLTVLRSASRDPLWRTTYSWLLATTVLWLAADSAGAWRSNGLPSASSASALLDLVRLLPFGTVMVAARLREHRFAGALEDASLRTPPATLELGGLLRGSLLLLQAAALPLLHITLSALGALDPLTERPQQACAFAVFVFVGGIAIADQKRLETESRERAATRLQAALAEHRAYHDALTGLPNRYLLLDHLKLALAQAKREQTRVAVFFLDLDRFKLINDSLGHTMGDQLVLAVAARLQHSLRETDTLARLGGDELTILAQGIRSPADAVTVGQKLLECVRRPFMVRGRELFVTASIGVSLYPDDALDAETLVKNADVAVYRAKAQGGDCCELFNPNMNEEALERLALENALRKAVPESQFVLYYQPVLDVSTGTTDGCEALLRWQHPEKGLLAPGVFMTLAEMTGVITHATPWILWNACLQAKAWQARHGRPLSIAVNLSARQFRDPDLVRYVDEALREAELDPGCLELEITESLAMENAEHTVRTLRQLKDLGVWISIDDFGTGYSSLSYLKAFPIDMLKIDKTFVRDIDTDPADAAIAATVVAIARTLRLRVVAEGVERKEQLAILRRQGCHRAQGYLFGHPMPALQFDAFLAAEREPAAKLPS